MVVLVYKNSNIKSEISFSCMPLSHTFLTFAADPAPFPSLPPLQVSDMIFEQPLSDYYVAKMLDYSPKVEFFMQFIIDLKIFVDKSSRSEPGQWALVCAAIYQLY